MHPIRRSAALEIAAAVAVLAVTAVLVATPPPADRLDPATATAGAARSVEPPGR